MNNINSFYCKMILVISLYSCNSKTSYLGQKTPGLTPELFAPSIVNTDSIELNSVFNKSLTEFFFTRVINESWIIHHSELVDGQWTVPQPIEMFPDQEVISVACDMTITPDGKTMYFLGSYQEHTSGDIFMSQKIDGKWQHATRIPEPISTANYSEIYPVVVADGSLYFVSDRPGGIGKRDIYRAQYLGNGEFDDPVSLGPVLNSENGSGDTYVSPDESYLIYNTFRPDAGIYVSFKKENEWQEPIYLDESINSKWFDFCPYMSPEGKYLFFSRRISDPPESGWDNIVDGKIYWVDANIIYNLNE